MNFTAMCATGVEMYIWADPNTLPVGSPEYIGACPDLVAGGGTKYGGCYNGWANQNAQTVPVGGVWTQITLAPTGGTWAADETSVTTIGVDVNMSATNQPASCDFVIDNVQIY